MYSVHNINVPCTLRSTTIVYPVCTPNNEYRKYQYLLTVLHTVPVASRKAKRFIFGGFTAPLFYPSSTRPPGTSNQ